MIIDRSSYESRLGADGAWHWRGTCTLTRDGIRYTYTGELVNGEPHGQGTRTNFSGRFYIGEYRGEYRNGKQHGKGIRVYIDGNRYEGEFVDDKRHGQGIFTGSDGSCYNGEWVDDKQHGKGIYTYPDRDLLKGEWEEGRLSRGTLQAKDGTFCVPTWGQVFCCETFPNKKTLKGKVGRAMLLDTDPSTCAFSKTEFGYLKEILEKVGYTVGHLTAKSATCLITELAGLANCISLLVIKCHGARDHMVFWNIPITDTDLTPLNTIFTEGAIIVLNSCCTGDDFSTWWEPCVAQKLRTRFQSKDVVVVAPSTLITFMGLHMRKMGEQEVEMEVSMLSPSSLSDVSRCFYPRTVP